MSVRLAIYGGTFDPVHDAHLTVAKEAVKVAGLDRVLLVPASDPPHKPGRAHAAYADRLRMVELACEREPHLEASDIERRAGRSYSIDTIRQVKDGLQVDDHLYFLIGADAFAEIETWYRWDEVVRLVTFLVVSRPGYAYRVPDGAKVERIDSLGLLVSSSEIRRRLALGECPPELSAPVLAYVREKGLYGFPARGRCAILE